MQVNVAEAKAKLSELIARAERGESVIIARDGAPVVTLTPVGGAPAGRRPGVFAHLLHDLAEDALIGPDADTAAALEDWERRPLSPGV